jgi:hypothetical protein
LELPL